MSDALQVTRPPSLIRPATVLRVEKLCKRFGGLHVFDEISFELA
jgi:hypothetical protein